MKTKNFPEKKNQRRKEAIKRLKGSINTYQQLIESSKNKETKKTLRKKKRRAIEELGKLEAAIVTSARELRTKKSRVSK